MTWNIFVDAGDTKTISYKVKVNWDYHNLKKIITSTGKVGGISSGTINNYVSYNLNAKEKENIAKEYNHLKDNYSGIELIDKIYENVFGVLEIEIPEQIIFIQKYYRREIY